MKLREKQLYAFGIFLLLLIIIPVSYFFIEQKILNRKLKNEPTGTTIGYVYKVAKNWKTDYYTIYCKYKVYDLVYETSDGLSIVNEIPINTPICIKFVKSSPAYSAYIIDTVLYNNGLKVEFDKFSNGDLKCYVKRIESPFDNLN